MKLSEMADVSCCTIRLDDKTTNRILWRKNDLCACYPSPDPSESDNPRGSFPWAISSFSRRWSSVRPFVSVRSVLIITMDEKRLSQPVWWLSTFGLCHRWKPFLLVIVNSLNRPTECLSPLFPAVMQRWERFSWPVLIFPNNFEIYIDWISTDAQRWGKASCIVRFQRLSS